MSCEGFGRDPFGTFRFGGCSPTATPQTYPSFFRDSKGRTSPDGGKELWAKAKKK